MAKRVAIGCDHAGVEMKFFVKNLLEEYGFEVELYGAKDASSVDYPDVAEQVCDRILSGAVNMGVLICGTGIGMSIAANRKNNIRAALCSEPTSAELTRRHNDANVLCIGARILGTELVRQIVDKFVTTSFEGGRHSVRIGKIDSVCGVYNR